MTIYSYSTTADLNSTVGGVNVAEGTAAANINNAIRAMMADLKGWANDIGAAASTTGSSNTYALTTSQTVASLADGIALMFIANHTNTGAATLNVDTLGAKAMRGPGDVALLAGDIVSGAPYLVAYDASANSGAGAWLVLNPSTTGNAALAALAALTPSANKLAYYTSGTAAALADLSAFGRTLIDDADAATARATLGLVLGTNVQAYDADLAAVAGLSSSGVIARTGSGTAASRTITGTANQITVTDGDGVSGNPTVAAVIASQVEAEAGTDATKLMTPQRVSQAIAALSPSTIPDYIRIEDQKSDGTNGGSAVSGSWQTRDLNTVADDAGGHASVASNQITLAAGTYDFRISAPFLAVNGVRLRLWNDSDSASVGVGPNANVGVGNTYNDIYSATVSGRLTIAGSKTFEVQYFCGVDRATDGLGTEDEIAAGVEIYTVAEFWKVA